MEARIQEAIRHLEEFPDSSLRAVAREYGVPRKKLWNRVEDQQPKKGQAAHNTKFSAAEELALCKYIDRLDIIIII